MSQYCYSCSRVWQNFTVGRQCIYSGSEVGQYLYSCKVMYGYLFALAEDCT